MVTQAQFQVKHNSKNSREVLTMDEDEQFKLHHEGEDKYYIQLKVDDSDKFNAEEQVVRSGDKIPLSVKQAMVWCEQTGNAEQFPIEVIQNR